MDNGEKTLLFKIMTIDKRELKQLCCDVFTTKMVYFGFKELYQQHIVNIHCSLTAHNLFKVKPI